ncbi:hypothetical protein IGI04_014147 [Brassica rapa subsp. trilocularis]|uniref:RING-type E3 ubiquitin transferase n=1 Tax=Brassica rapa subsp. trilocularis TaxID=1813537 RepID=A0ABQ7MLD8_BRACM|nr:hypothetical protein IGI04_014147 [Brassica rapa subsp. trilocularis]
MIAIQETVKTVGSLRFCGSESVETSKRDMVMDDKIYVAVTGRDLESKSSLVWAIQNSGGREFCIVYVQKLRLCRKEKERAHKSIDKYLNICRQMQVSAEKICIEMGSVEEGILHLISNREVKKLVMGAAADRHYSMRMRDLQSKKSIYIHREAPATCHIWFTCKGYLICSREARRRDHLYLEWASLDSSSQSETTKGTQSVPSSSMVKDDDRIQVSDAIKMAKQSENVYINELKCKKETEKALSKTKEELEKMIRKLQYKYSLSMEALRRLRQEQEELKIELREVSKLKSNRKNHGPPQYFICPITQDVMEDPHVAADGFTYEGEAISSWFERGHETSPMTNKSLPHTSLGARENNMEEEEEAAEERIYVAVGSETAKNKSNLTWAIDNSEGRKICIVLVHQPAQMIPVLGTKFHAATVDEELVRAYREKEKAKADKILDEYLRICLQKRVHAEKLCVEMDSIEKGIVQMISQNRVKKFVMGAAADKHYSTKMVDLRSRKAIFVCQQASVTCHIRFVCKGHLINTREPIINEGEEEEERISRTSSCRSASTSSYYGGSEASSSIDEASSSIDEVSSIITEETISNHSPPPSLPCSGMGLGMITFLINSTKLLHRLAIQNQKQPE